MCEGLGWGTLFSQIPRGWQEGMVALKPADPKITFELGDRKRKEDRELREAVERAVREATMEVDLFQKVFVRDFYTFLPLLASASGSEAREEWPDALAIFLDEVGPAADILLKHYQKAASIELAQEINSTLMRYSRIDARFLTTNWLSEPGIKQLSEIQITVSSDKPQMIRADVDGKPRRLYRVGGDDTQGGIAWQSWRPSVLGLRGLRGVDSDDPRPVYVQSHALRHMRSRLHLGDSAAFLDAWLNDAVRKPVVVDRHGEDLLVEFRINEARLGYLFVTPMPDKFVIRTFLFLTMAPSPEFRQLERRLKLSRRDADWLGLTTLSAFVESDLRDDERIRELFTACGCGHLFSLDASYYASDPKPLARDVESYLRLAA